MYARLVCFAADGVFLLFDIGAVAQWMSFDERPKGGGPLAGSALRAQARQRLFNLIIGILNAAGLLGE